MMHSLLLTTPTLQQNSELNDNIEKKGAIGTSAGDEQSKEKKLFTDVMLQGIKEGQVSESLSKAVKTDGLVHVDSDDSLSMEVEGNLHGTRASANKAEIFPLEDEVNIAKKSEVGSTELRINDGLIKTHTMVPTKVTVETSSGNTSEKSSQSLSTQQPEVLVSSLDEEGPETVEKRTDFTGIHDSNTEAKEVKSTEENQVLLQIETALKLDVSVKPPLDIKNAVLVGNSEKILTAPVEDRSFTTDNLSVNEGVISVENDAANKHPMHTKVDDGNGGEREIENEIESEIKSLVFSKAGHQSSDDSNDNKSKTSVDPIRRKSEDKDFMPTLSMHNVAAEDEPTLQVASQENINKKESTGLNTVHSEGNQLGSSRLIKGSTQSIMENPSPKESTIDEEETIPFVKDKGVGGDKRLDSPDSLAANLKTDSTVVVHAASEVNGGKPNQIGALQSDKLLAVNQHIQSSNNLLQQPLDMQSKQTAAMMGERVMMMLSQGKQEIQIRLDPAELGSMLIKVQVQQDQVQLYIQTQIGLSKEILDQNMPRLREELAQQGVQLGETDVQQQEQQQSKHPQSKVANATQNPNQKDIEQENETMSWMPSKIPSRDQGIDFYA